MKKPISDIIECGENKRQNRSGDDVVTHYSVDKRTADEACRHKKKSIEARTRGENIPECTCKKSENQAPHITLIHSYADNCRNKKQSPDAENLRKISVRVLQNGYEQNYQSKAESAEYEIFLLCFKCHVFK